ncbi:hypothetical protein RUND412_011657, partial [Rhizina undulata]
TQSAPPKGPAPPIPMHTRPRIELIMVELESLKKQRQRDQVQEAKNLEIRTQNLKTLNEENNTMKKEIGTMKVAMDVMEKRMTGMAQALERQRDELITQMDEIRNLRDQRKPQQSPPTPSRPLTLPPRIALMTETRLGQPEFDVLHKIEETVCQYLGTIDDDLVDQIYWIITENEPNDWQLKNWLDMNVNDDSMLEELTDIWEKVWNQSMAKEPWMEFEPEDIPEPEEPRTPVFMSGIRLGGTVRLAAMTKDGSPKTQIKEVCSYCEKPDHCMDKCPDWLKILNLGLDKPKDHLPTTIKVAMEPCEVCGDEGHTEVKCRAMGLDSDSESDKEELPKGNTIVRAMRVGNVIMDTEVCSFCEKPGH